MAQNRIGRNAGILNREPVVQGTRNAGALGAGVWTDIAYGTDASYETVISNIRYSPS